MTKENVLVQMETARIKRIDAQNVVVEVLKEKPADTYKNPRTGETFERPDRSEWEFWGYYPSTHIALQCIFKNDLLLGDESRTLEEYIDKSLKALEEICRHA